MIGLLLLTLSGPVGPRVIVTVAAPAVVLSTTEPQEIEVVAVIREGFRIQANPARQPFLVPALLEFEDNECVWVGRPAYPPGERYRLRGAAEDLSVYRHTVTIRVPVAARPGPAATPCEGVLLEGRLRYQACSAEVCLRPSSVRVRVPVSIREEPPAEH